MSEWVFRSLLRWACTLDPGELERLVNDKTGKWFAGGGRMLTSTAHGGKSATYSFPVGMGVAEMQALLEKVLWFLSNYPCDSDEFAYYMKAYPTQWGRTKFGVYWP